MRGKAKRDKLADTLKQPPAFFKMKLPKVAKEDWKYMKPDPDEGFDPERNRRVIERTIKKNDTLRERKMKQFNEGLGERVDAAAHYVKHLAWGHSTPAEKYFGRKYLAYLRGKYVMDRVRDELTIIKNDKVIRKAGDVIEHL